MLITSSATFTVPSCSLSSSAVCVLYRSHWLVTCSPTIAHFFFSSSFPFFYIYSNCVSFSSPGLLPSSHSLFLQLFFSFLSLCHCDAFPFSLFFCSATLSYSLLCPQHTKQKFCDYFSSRETLDTGAVAATSACCHDNSLSV